MSSQAPLKAKPLRQSTMNLYSTGYRSPLFRAHSLPMPAWRPLLIGCIALFSVTANFVYAADSVERSIHISNGTPDGFQEVRHQADGSISVHWEFNDRGRGPKLDSTYRLAADGTPLKIDTEGVNFNKAPVSEHFSQNQGEAHWQSLSENERRAVNTAAFYNCIDSAPEGFTLLARALLKAPGQKLDLLPVGHVSLVKLGEETVQGKRGSRKVVLYVVTGLNLKPDYVWLDAKGSFFADWDHFSSLVAEGWEDTLPQIDKYQVAQELALSHAHATSLTQHVNGLLAIEHVRVFDPDRLAEKPGQTVLVVGGRITAVGDDGSVAVPKQARHIDGQNRFLMPGLWDMHQHLDSGDGLLDLAAGITTVRDLGNLPEQLAAIQNAYESGDEMGPRIIKAGLIDGRGPYQSPVGLQADTAEEAVRQVDRYASQGYVQIKIYSSMKPELVPVIVKEAHARGLRVSGHVPAFMTAEQFVNDGVDEIQHINFLFLNFLFDRVQDTRGLARFTAVAEHGAELDLSSPRVRSFIDLLKQHYIVIDPTIAHFETKFLERPGLMGPSLVAVLDRLPGSDQRFQKTGCCGLNVPPGMDARYRESYARMVQMVGVLYRSGVPLVIGTDGNGFLMLPREFEVFVSAGIPPADVLRMATLGAAQVMKRDNEFGRIAPGYVADLILVDGDPLINVSDMRKVRTVLRGDRLYDTTSLFQVVGLAPAR
jgi:imidazolonepropionase-like amidohydrolase